MLPLGLIKQGGGPDSAVGLVFATCALGPQSSEFTAGSSALGWQMKQREDVEDLTGVKERKSRKRS